MTPAEVVRLTFVALALPGAGGLFASPDARGSSHHAVCRELQQQYAALADANARRDLEAILALRDPNFSAIFPSGQRGTYDDMANRSRQLVEMMRPPITVRNTILSLSVEGETAVVTVLQEFSRRQVMGGAERKVETSAIQRETWRRGAGSWRLLFVDEVRDRRWFVDGKRVDPDRPPDPNAPPFETVDPPRPPKPENCGLPPEGPGGER